MMSFRVTNPATPPSLFTSGSFSIRFSCRTRSASFNDISGSAVMTFSCMTALTGFASSSSNNKSRVVTMPTSFSSAFKIRIPPVPVSSIKFLRSPTVCASVMVIGCSTTKDSAFFTRSIWRACSAIERKRWMIPMPPSRAMAIAISRSVTTSMLADTIGICRLI